MKLYVNIQKEKNERIVTFLKRCYAKAHCGWEHKFTETYNNKECSLLQCDKRRRSFDDLLNVVKTYYPKVSDKHIAKQIEKLTKPYSINNKARLHFLYCPEADRWIMYELSAQSFTYLGEKYLYMSSYGKSPQKKDCRGVGQRTYTEILALMGYNEDQYTL